MAPITNVEALDRYAVGWSTGNSEIIHTVLDKSYVLNGLPDASVNYDNFFEFFKKFRADIAAGGGPAVEDVVFMKFTNLIRKNVEDTMVESARFEVPGFASGVYMAAAKEGKVIWEQVAM